MNGANTRANGRFGTGRKRKGKDGGWDKLENDSGAVKYKRGGVPTASKVLVKL